MLNIGALLHATAAKYPERPAFIEAGTGISITYAELEDEVEMLATRLWGVVRQPGARVALLVSNSMISAMALLAVPRAGYVTVCLNYRSSAAELNAALVDCGAALLLVTADLRPAAEEVARLNSSLCPTIVIDGPDDEALLGPQPISELPDGGAQDSDPAVILYSSGTSGRPKGIVKSHASCTMGALNNALALGLTAEDIYLHTGWPLAGVGWYNLCLPNVIVGASIVVMGRFDSERVCSSIEQHKATYAYLLPSMWVQLLTGGIRATDLASMRFLHWGGEPMRADLFDAIIRDINVPLRAGYGSTEGGLSISDAGDEVEGMRCVGRATGIGEFAVFDRTGRPVDIGVVGEIVHRGPAVMTGYHNNAEATAAAIVNGWLRTADVGYRDNEGRLFVVGRQTDMIISGGFNIFPSEVESVVAEHPDVRDCAVVGVPDARWGEVLRAVIVPGVPGLDRAAIRQWCEARLASFKVPKQIIFVDTLPHNAFGKVERHLLRDIAP